MEFDPTVFSPPETDAQDVSESLKGLDALAVSGMLQEALNEVPHSYRFEGFDPLERVADLLMSQRQRAEQSSRKVMKNCTVIDGCLRKLVEEYYDGFNVSVRNFSTVLQLLPECQKQAGSISQSLREGERFLNTHSDDVGELWLRRHTSQLVTDTLKSIQGMAAAPPEIDHLLKAKDFYAAAVLYKETENKFADQVYGKIPGLEDLRLEMSSRKDLIREALFAELDSTLYLVKPGTVESYDLQYPAGRNSSFVGSPSGSALPPAIVPIPQNSTPGVKKMRTPSSARLSLHRASSLADLMKDSAAQSSSPSRSGFAAVSGTRRKQKSRLGNSRTRGIKRLSSLSFVPPTELDHEDAAMLHELFVSGRPLTVDQDIRLLSHALDVMKLMDLACDHVRHCMPKEVQSLIFATLSDCTDVNRKDVDKDGDVAFVLGKVCDRLLKVLKAHTVFLTYMQTFRQRSNEALSESLRPRVLSIYQAEDVWNVIQQELKVVVADMLDFMGQSYTVARQSDREAGAAPAKPSHLFRFSFTRAQTSTLTASWMRVEGGARDSELQEKVRMLYKPSAYNIGAVYQPLIKTASTAVNGILGVEDGRWQEYAAPLLSLLDFFMQSHFIPKLASNFAKKMASIVEDATVFQPVGGEGRDGHSQSALMKGTRKVLHLVRELVSYVVDEKYVEEISRQMDSLLDRFYNHNVEYMESILSSSAVGKLVAHPDFVTLVTNSPHYGAIKSGEVVDPEMKELTAFYLELSQIEKSCLQGTLERRHLLDLDQIYSLVLMHSSLDFLSSELGSEQTYGRPPNQPGAKSGTGGPVDTHPNTLQPPLISSRLRQTSGSSMHLRKVPLADSPSGTGVRRRTSRSQSHVSGSSLARQMHVDKASQIRDNLRNTTQKLSQLADKCLVVVWMELRLHCVYYLENMRASIYHLREQATEPEPFVLDLNRDLAMIHGRLVDMQDSEKTGFLFGDLARLISDTLINMLPALRNINQNGVAKVNRNINALQQNLTNIVDTNAAFFDRARQFYGLLRLDGERLLQSLSDQASAQFSIDEYKQILHFVAPGRRDYSQMLVAIFNQIGRQKERNKDG